MRMFSSDFHLGHRVITKYRPQFKSIEEHDNAIFDEMSKLGKRDILYILGDFIFDGNDYGRYISIMDKMSCRIKLVMGNHDSLKLYKEPRFEMQLPLFSYKGIWLSHCPIHEKELRKRVGNIHGHLHGGVIESDRYFNVCLDNNKNKFVDFEYIESVLRKEEV